MKSDVPPRPRAGRSSATRAGREATEVLMEKGLPADIDVEKLILGSLLLDGSRFIDIAPMLREDDFALEKHRRIFARMSALHSRGEPIDRVIVANELMRYGELESVDGIGYLVTLDDGLPRIAHLDSYVNIIRDKATLRRIAIAAQHLMTRALLAEEEPAEILTGAEEMLRRLSQGARANARSFSDITLIGTIAAQKLDWVVHTILAAGTVTLITGDSGSGKSSLVTAICHAISLGDALAGLRTQQRPVLYLDRENPIPIVAERFKRLGISDSNDFKYWGGWCPAEPAVPSSPTLMQWVNSCEVKPVVVVDSFAGFSDGADENDAAQVRAFMDGPRRLADMGATVIVLHNSSVKTETAKEYRGSSDFKASVDIAYHLVNLSSDPSRLSTLRLRAFKARFAVAPEIVLNYVDGEFRIDSRGPAQTGIQAFRDLLIANPGIKSREFEVLATQKGLGRNKARDFIKKGIDEDTIRVEEGPTHNEQRHTWIGSSPYSEMGDGL